MYHATGIRNNLRNKYESSSLSNINRERINDISDSINNLSENNLTLTFYGKNNLPVNIECEISDELF
jgi:predicted AAA+ superfamily ATPase